MKVDRKRLDESRECSPNVHINITRLEQMPIPNQKGIRVSYEQLGLAKPRQTMWQPVAAACVVSVALLAFVFIPQKTLTEDTKVMNVNESIMRTAKPEVKTVMAETATRMAISAEPKPTKSPGPTRVPEPTKKPEMTKKPKVTEKPKTVKKPKVAEKTKIIERPKATEKPKTSKKGWISLGSGWTITHYCPGACCNGKYAGSTSTGAKMKPYHTIAVDPSVIPYGTHVKIDGMDYEFVAEDRGSAIKGKRIDVLVENCTVARKLGKIKNATVRIRKAG